MDVSELKERLYGIGPVKRIVTAGHVLEIRPKKAMLARMWPDLSCSNHAEALQAADALIHAFQAYERSLFNVSRVDHKMALADDVALLNERAAVWFRGLPGEVRREVRARLRSHGLLFWNESLFGETSGLVLSHNFSPSLDPAALVCTKRLREMQRAFEDGISWNVVSQDMSSNTAMDPLFEGFYGRFSASSHREMHEVNSNEERVAVEWGNRAFDLVKDEEYDICYSHAMFAASHVAGRLYKKAHPNTVWIAEIGDPLYIDLNGEPRQPTQSFTGNEEYLNTFWHDVEADTLREADVIIFNNDGLRDIVLAKTRDREAARRAAERVVIAHNCTIDGRFAHLLRMPLQFNDDSINVAYLGSISKSRPFETLEPILENERVELYLYLAMSWTLTPVLDNLPADVRARVHICEPVTHLEALNICSQMDYCMVNDTLFPYEPNPFQPSKYFDYIAAGRPIIAFTQKNSPIDKDAYDGLLRAHTVEEMRELALTLEKQG